jgi:hypothetical protein
LFISGNDRENNFHHGGDYLISNYHVVKGAAKVRLLTGAGKRRRQNEE